MDTGAKRLLNTLHWILLERYLGVGLTLWYKNESGLGYALIGLKIAITEFYTTGLTFQKGFIK